MFMKKIIFIFIILLFINVSASTSTIVMDTNNKRILYQNNLAEYVRHNCFYQYLIHSKRNLQTVHILELEIANHLL